MTSRSMARFGAPFLFVACAAYEVISIALGKTWPGFTQEMRVGAGLVAAALWVASAVVLAIETRKALYLPVFGAFMLVTLAFTARAGGSARELVYLAVFPLVVLLQTIDIKALLGIDREHVVLRPTAA